MCRPSCSATSTGWWSRAGDRRAATAGVRMSAHDHPPAHATPLNSAQTVEGFDLPDSVLGMRMQVCEEGPKQAEPSADWPDESVTPIGVLRDHRHCGVGLFDHRGGDGSGRYPGGPGHGVAHHEDHVPAAMTQAACFIREAGTGASPLPSVARTRGRVTGTRRPPSVTEPRSVPCRVALRPGSCLPRGPHAGLTSGRLPCPTSFWAT